MSFISQPVQRAAFQSQFPLPVLNLLCHNQKSKKRSALKELWSGQDLQIPYKDSWDQIPNRKTIYPTRILILISFTAKKKELIVLMLTDKEYFNDPNELLQSTFYPYFSFFFGKKYWIVYELHSNFFIKQQKTKLYLYKKAN